MKQDAKLPGAAQLATMKNLAEALPAEVALTRKAGLPIDANDLRELLKASRADNAAPIYKQLTKGKSNGDVSVASGDLLKVLLLPTAGAKELASGKALLAQQATRIALFEKAVGQTGCHFDRRWENGAAVIMPEYATLREGARLLAVKAAVQSLDGRPLEALDTLQKASRLASHAAQDASLIAMLVAIAISAILDRAFQRVVGRHADRADVLTRAKTVSRSLTPPLDWRRSFGAELVMMHSMVRPLVAHPEQVNFWGMGDGAPNLSAFPPATRKLVFESGEVQILRYWRAFFAHPRTSDADLRALVRWTEAFDAKVTGGADPSFILWAVFTPVIAQSIDKVLQLRAMERQREMLVTLLSARHASGELPKAPALTPDPFDGKPLRYRSDGKSFTLWSVGQNRKDDGGVAKIGDALADLVVRWPG